jgi:hypothetical protein
MKWVPAGRSSVQRQPFGFAAALFYPCKRLMTTFLCWNLNKKPLQDLVAQVVRSRDIDVVILLECHISVASLLLTLNPEGELLFQYAGTPADIQGEAPTGTIKIFTRFASKFLEALEDDDRLTIRRLKLPLRTEVILAVVHFRSKLHWRNSSQMFECANLTRTIADVEKRVGHTRTILVGDFNMNPFEEGLVAAAGLNATMTRRQALEECRTIRSKVYPFFFNPMWEHFGDGDRRPAGTYYYSSDDHVMYYWNMYDQVLVRPSLVEQFPKDGIEILTYAGTVSLLKPNGRPDKVAASDHLPLLFRLEL